MTDDNPDPWERTRLSHLPLCSGEIVTVHLDDQIVMALYEPRSAEETENDMAEPGLVIAMTPSECEELGSQLTYAAIAAYSRRPKLRVVDDPEDEEGP